MRRKATARSTRNTRSVISNATYLSGDFDADKIEASLANGVLRLTIPRAEQAEV